MKTVLIILGIILLILCAIFLCWAIPIFKEVLYQLNQLSGK